MVNSDSKNEFLNKFTQSFVDSFNYAIGVGINNSLKDIQPLTVKLKEDLIVKIQIIHIHVGMPRLDQNISSSPILTPSECRVRGISYAGRITARFCWSVNGVSQPEIIRPLGNIPIMIRSQLCWLNGRTSNELIKMHEEANEFGGYFVCNGLERVLRMLIQQRRNYPIAVIRSAWKGRTPLMTDHGILLRCVDENQSQNMNFLHYLSNGSFTYSFVFRDRQYFIPLIYIIKMLTDYCDYEIFVLLSKAVHNNLLAVQTIKDTLSECAVSNLVSRTKTLELVGEKFRSRLMVTDSVSNIECAKILIERCICIHLKSDMDKFNLILYMVEKLQAMVDKKISSESADSLMNQEIMLPGHIILMVLKDKLSSYMGSLNSRLTALHQSKPMTVSTLSSAAINTAMGRSFDVGAAVEFFIRTGNINSKNGIGLSQNSGFTLLADKLNFMRYLSHFRSVHRGSSFAKSYSTSVRKLLPECWGFICPVHTPDGAPCGLLNHLALTCEISTQQVSTDEIIDCLKSLGLQSCDGVVVMPLSLDNSYIHVMIDGNVVGMILNEDALRITSILREFKIQKNEQYEISLVEKYEDGGGAEFPGLYIFTSPCRPVRPVWNKSLKCVEMIGCHEQVFMNISASEKEDTPEHSHMEIDPILILSDAASLIPFSDLNQSPRNMYQCQMAKQSLGTSMYSYKHRFDNKIYRLMTPQSPICNNANTSLVHMDDYPQGFNAVVAVISYTGCDMEDAMVINKSALERGFAHASIYKSILIDLVQEGSSGNSSSGTVTNLRFGRDPKKPALTSHLDVEGLPMIGTRLKYDDPFYCYYDICTNIFTVRKYKGDDIAYVEDVAALGRVDPTQLLRVNIRLRMNRNPIVGDKFASRHGQKGVLSSNWPSEDMPFTESGIIPDIIFNPHGFPSRMTIGMIIETMAAKSGAVYGKVQNSTPFQEISHNFVEHFGQELTSAGFNHYGTEMLFCGTNGLQLQAEIFFGIVYYQRLRHMISDKFQVRSTGPVDQLTHQPVHGRKRHGGVRFGEMERDALIAHGTSFLLQDRLFHCSDKSEVLICTTCRDISSCHLQRISILHGIQESKSNKSRNSQSQKSLICSICKSGASVKRIMIPYVLKYLVSELAAVNISLKFELASR